MNQFGAVIETLEQTIAAIHPSAYPALLGEIERMKGLLWQRLLFEKGVDTPRDAEEAKLLTIPQAAKLMAIPGKK